MSVDTLGRLIDILGIDPSSLYRLAKRAGVEGTVMRIIPDSLKRSLGQGVDWRNSMAYCRSESEQGIRINLEGRDPDGVVSETEYESVREGIINIMSNLRTPDGDLVFQFVCKRERMYTGPNVDQACDILFRTKEMNHPVSTKLYGDVFLPINNFNHKDTGIFIGSGPDINETVNIDTVALTDIAPIVMGLLEQPVPERMSGSIPDNLIKKETTRRPYENVEFMKSTNYSHNQTEVADRLRDLGYLG
jgi:predicted AlkP superfamily phosphohydrolase/phosphomutase